MGSGSNYVGMIFLVNLIKKVTKHVGVVRLCWNEFQSKVNDKNMIKSGELGQIMLEWFSSLLVNLTKKWENIWELSNYVGMNFLAKQTTKMW